MTQADADKLNRRTTYEWEQFMSRYGVHWDDLTDEGKQAACALAEKQGDRSAALWWHHG